MMLDKIIPIVLKAVASVAKEPVQQNAIYIKTLKRFGWDPEHPPAEFSAAYAYTLVEYALTEEEKSEALLQLLAEPEIKEAFRQAFYQWDDDVLTTKLNERLTWQEYDNEWNFIGTAISAQSIDVQREVIVFFRVFLDVVERTQTQREGLEQDVG